jgi:hypothetical protein
MVSRPSEEHAAALMSLHPRELSRLAARFVRAADRISHLSWPDVGVIGAGVVMGR